MGGRPMMLLAMMVVVVVVVLMLAMLPATMRGTRPVLRRNGVCCCGRPCCRDGAARLGRCRTRSLAGLVMMIGW